MPVFTGEQFEMSFLERLKWFSKVKLDNYLHLATKLNQEESDTNTIRLGQTGYTVIEKPQSEGADMKAVFMPAPGIIPPARRDILAENGVPWGGKFLASPVARTQNASILNLFELAQINNKEKKNKKRN